MERYQTAECQAHRNGRQTSCKNESGCAGEVVILLLMVMGELAPQSRDLN